MDAVGLPAAEVFRGFPHEECWSWEPTDVQENLSGRQGPRNAVRPDLQEILASQEWRGGKQQLFKGGRASSISSYSPGQVPDSEITQGWAVACK